MKKIISILFVLVIVLSGCGYSTTYVPNGEIVIRSTKTIPYEAENYSRGKLLTAIRITGITVRDDENYVTKNRDAEITITYEVLYSDHMTQDVFLVDIIAKNGSYPMIQDGRMYGDSSKKIQAKDICLGFNTKQVHTRDSITFSINDIEKGEYDLVVKGNN